MRYVLMFFMAVMFLAMPVMAQEDHAENITPSLAPGNNVPIKGNTIL